MPEVNEQVSEQERTKIAKALLEETVSNIAKEKLQYSRRGKRLRTLNSIFNVCTIIFGIAAPALVTYQTQQPNTNFELTIASILLVAVAGATAALRGVLRWGERYGYTVMTAMKLRELESNVRLAQEDILNTTKESDVYAKLSVLNKEAQKLHIEIIKRQLEQEVAVVEKAETEKSLVPKSDDNTNSGI